MQVLIDLRQNPAAVDRFLSSLPAVTSRVRLFNRIGFGVLDVDGIEILRGKQQGLGIYPAKTLQPFPLIPAGPAIRFDRFIKSEPASWNFDLIVRKAFPGRGKNVVVGHIDTGLDPLHPALSGKPSRFCAIRQDASIDEHVTPFARAGHGTATASIICGDPVLGVAPDVTLCSAALDESSWTTPMVTAAIDWMIVQKVRVLWLGVELPGEYLPELEIQMTRLADANINIVPVVAIGNDGAGTSSTPGNCHDGLSTGAVGKAGGQVYVWGRSGSQTRPDGVCKPDLVAPGHEVMGAATVRMPSYTERLSQPFSGTSFAGPHVVGLASLCLELKPSLTAKELIAGLKASCQPMGLPADRAGAGVPDGEKLRSVLHI